MQWELFDPDEEVRITAGRLPHWFQPGRLFFITFRTNDSLPASVAKLWLKRRDDWLRRQGIDPLERLGVRNSSHCPPRCGGSSTRRFPRNSLSISTAVMGSAC